MRFSVVDCWSSGRKVWSIGGGFARYLVVGSWIIGEGCGASGLFAHVILLSARGAWEGFCEAQRALARVIMLVGVENAGGIW